MPMTVAKVHKSYAVAGILKAAGIPAHAPHRFGAARTDEGGFNTDEDLNAENSVVVRWTYGKAIPDGEEARQEIERRLTECAVALMYEGYWVSRYPNGGGLRVVKLEWL